MLKIIAERLRQKYRTVGFPEKAALLPDRFRGRPHISQAACVACAGEFCAGCAQVCPTAALGLEDGLPVLDLGLCTFCGACERACPAKAISFTREYRLAVRDRQELFITPTEHPYSEAPAPMTPEHLTDAMHSLFKRSFRIRQVSAAGCNACEADCNVLTTIVFDLARFGIDFVASPRHADAVLVTGPVTRNMQKALHKCYAVMPGPKLVLAVGACAISGGLFRELDQDGYGVDAQLPVDVYIPGCPPHPYTILEGLLRCIGHL